MAQLMLEEIAAANRAIMYRLDLITHVLNNAKREPVRCEITVRRQHVMDLHPRVSSYVDADFQQPYYLGKYTESYQ
ncbi:hypothetical protein PIB30_089510, partial [Stylosanthes scabra]|nr:hypothetical protein [Stylosanthes scabra]